jgi:DNA (cytosine-5)-methyltransferase 1
MREQGELNELALFAGAGGGILGGKLLGWRTVCAVEWEPYPASVLCARQNDGLLAPFPIWDDVQTFDGRPWRGIVDVVSGGFPCQDISAAGKGAGITGSRSGLWSEMARIIGEVQPRYAFVENSPVLTSRGLGTVLGDLAALGFDARWGVVSAADVGAPHLRERIWIMAYSNSNSQSIGAINAGSLQKTNLDDSNGFGCGKPDILCEQQRGTEIVGAGEVVANSTSVGQQTESNSKQYFQTHKVGQTNQFRSGSKVFANSNISQRQGNWREKPNGEENGSIRGFGWWLTEPNVGRVANGVAARVDRLKAIGNGQVPGVAATAWRILNAP